MFLMGVVRSGVPLSEDLVMLFSRRGMLETAKREKHGKRLKAAGCSPIPAWAGQGVKAVSRPRREVLEKDWRPEYDEQGRVPYEQWANDGTVCGQCWHYLYEEQDNFKVRLAVLLPAQEDLCSP